MSGGKGNEYDSLSNGERIEMVTYLEAGALEPLQFGVEYRQHPRRFSSFGIRDYGGRESRPVFESVRTAYSYRVALSEMRALIWWYTPFNTPHVLESSSTEVP